ncbi:hypothetical protein GOP47_0025577 [Adiantum capillus-veneris]|uniref:Protein farnesyltransferase subunit beta n=1 Tax=Adiantum capillus-veneris TaxID=13818 RepID=A0A9D4Z2C5_ADICA|nr:hypothetical protein GOP47_0025577 [Adiantum capillus-veneris]
MACKGGADGLTETQTQQKELEEKVKVILQAFASGSAHHHSLLLELWRLEHAGFCLKGLTQLGPSFCVLDANRPWLCFWILHSLALLGEQIDVELGFHVVDFLSRCEDPRGGYGGGPGQMPHLATTYAAVFSLVTIGGDHALASIKRERILDFLLQMKDPSGGFRMHKNGEIDVRGCYTAIAVAHILDLLLPPVIAGVAEYISSCQTHEGGIGGEPGAEAHGGYTYCGLAALVLINQAHHLDLPALLNWAVFRQGNVEGGFQGRVNKLVDGCYSFWQGGIFPLLQMLPEQLLLHGTVKRHDEDTISPMNELNTSAECSRMASVSAASLFRAIKDGRSKHVIYEIDEGCPPQGSSSDYTNFLADYKRCPLFNTQALQGYILLCCQVLEGGLRDKPGKARDYYHTCYCLSGLSIAQFSLARSLSALPLPSSVLGPFDNLLSATHPLCNVVLDKYYDANRFFSSTSPQ